MLKMYLRKMGLNNCRSNKTYELQKLLFFFIYSPKNVLILIKLYVCCKHKNK